MPHFLYLIRPKNDWSTGNMSEEEAKLMGEHFMYLKQKFDEGKVMMVGPCVDTSMGIGILETDTREEAEEIGYNDPAVKAGIVTLEIKDYIVSLWRNEK